MYYVCNRSLVFAERDAHGLLDINFIQLELLIPTTYKHIIKQEK